MNSTQIVQMALSAVVRCNEQIDIFVLNNVLCGSHTKAVTNNNFHRIKTFGAGKAYSNRLWFYWLFQMIQQGLLLVDYEKSCYLKVTQKGKAVLNGTLEVNLITPKNCLLSFTRNGVKFEIEFELQDAIDWKGLTSQVGKEIYWNYKEAKKIDVNALIPPTTKNHGVVKSRFIEIIKRAYGVENEGDILIIPKKVDLDIYGNEVKALTDSFETCLEKLKKFIIAKGRYPELISTNEEAALRKWFREVSYGLIHIEPRQEAAFQQFTNEYPLTRKNNNN